MRLLKKHVANYSHYVREFVRFSDFFCVLYNNSALFSMSTAKVAIFFAKSAIFLHSKLIRDFLAITALRDTLRDTILYILLDTTLYNMVYNMLSYSAWQGREEAAINTIAASFLIIYLRFQHNRFFNEAVSHPILVVIYS